MNSTNEGIVAAQVEAMLCQLPGVKIQREYLDTSGMRVDFLVTTRQGDRLMVEVKLGQSGYLPVSSWGQLVMNKKLLEEWGSIERVTPMIVTNLEVPPDLEAMFQRSRIVVVKLKKDAGEMIRAVRDQLEQMGIDLGPSPSEK